jgi:hypothetical protein
MKAEDYVRSKAPKVRVVERVGTYSSGGAVRTEIYLGRTMIGASTKPKSAWAEAMRWLKERGNG